MVCLCMCSWQHPRKKNVCVSIARKVPRDAHAEPVCDSCAKARQLLQESSIPERLEGPIGNEV